ncbi:putative bifunctional diguanylate cyclase/phosphodiesterase [Methylococcus capsulatus]|uniref:putative bifunctional diguanylate cyclase/phosphodiesterase n=1 Tax=Methylococcus capsulatus TaxID=414 RepID=UPI001C52A094|nr:EAL domain-containing protein [Methylococcus capsulatus]QXP88722.1 EAL domain-containing protein [Methylococcus capsulatus]UQN11001.1 EAL domain-containing protein [Methylococcus capsulatus]
MSDVRTNEAEKRHAHPDFDAARFPADARVRVLARRFPPYHRDSPCLAILDRFLHDPTLSAAAVVDDAMRPVGLIDRYSLVEQFLHPYSRDLYHKHSIAAFMDPEPVIVEADSSIDDLSRIIIDAGMRHMVSGFIVTEGGLYLGIGSGHDLFEEVANRKQNHLYHLAHYDPLTSLPNRLLLNDRLKRACLRGQRGGYRIALLFIDLDRFKLVNDTLGHAAGDQLLQGVAGRFAACVRKVDTVARLGGDEFTVLLEPVQGPDEALAVAAKLAQSLERPFLIQNHEITTSASIGVVLFPEHDATVEGLMRKADAAMYCAKREGRNRFALFTEEMNSTVVERVTLESYLNAALEKGEFCCHFQPQMATADDRIVGVEALLRWTNPVLGRVPPLKFIPVAEDTGLILPLGLWALETACAQQVRWLSQGLPPLRMAVNISPLQFRNREFCDQVRAIVQRTGIRAEHLELELTESAVMADAESSVGILRELRDSGIRLAIDDFGTGYSSLSYLRKFPLDRLKIDRSFVSGIDRIPANELIVKAIVALGGSLGLDVIAEGVETPEELECIERCGCSEYQGFRLSEPLTAEDFAHWFEDSGYV